MLGLQEPVEFSIGKLEQHIKEEHILHYFSMFGDPIKCIKLRAKQNSREAPTAFLRLIPNTPISSIIGADHYLGGTAPEINILGKKGIINTSESINALCIYNIPSEATAEEFVEYLKELGELVYLRLYLIPGTDRLKGLGLAIFEKEEDYARILGENSVKFNNSELSFNFLKMTEEQFNSGLTKFPKNSTFTFDEVKGPLRELIDKHTSMTDQKNTQEGKAKISTESDYHIEMRAKLTKVKSKRPLYTIGYREINSKFNFGLVNPKVFRALPKSKCDLITFWKPTQSQRLSLSSTSKGSLSAMHYWLDRIRILRHRKLEYFSTSKVRTKQLKRAKKMMTIIQSLSGIDDSISE